MNNKEGEHITRCEFKKYSSIPHRINSGVIWKSFFCSFLSWEKRGEEKDWLSLISWASLSCRELQHCCCFKPLEQCWHSSTLSRFHWLSQQLPIKRYLPGSLRAAKERQEQRTEGDDEEGVRRRQGEEWWKKETKEKVKWGRAVSAA